MKCIPVHDHQIRADFHLSFIEFFGISVQFSPLFLQLRFLSVLFLQFVFSSVLLGSSPTLLPTSRAPIFKISAERRLKLPRLSLKAGNPAQTLPFSPKAGEIRTGTALQPQRGQNPHRLCSSAPTRAKSAQALLFSPKAGEIRQPRASP